MPTWINDLLELKDIIKGSLKSTAIISALISSGVALINGYLLRRQNKLLKDDISKDVTNQIQNDFVRQNIHLEMEREALSESVKSSLDGLSQDQYLIYQMRWLGAVSNLNKELNLAYNNLMQEITLSNELTYVNTLDALLVYFYAEEDEAIRKSLDTTANKVLSGFKNNQFELASEQQHLFNEIISDVLTKKSRIINKKSNE